MPYPLGIKMKYNFDLIEQLCRELSFPFKIQNDNLFKVAVGPAIFLCFRNAELDNDCLIEFEGTPWHTHDEFMFSDRHGYYVEMDYLDVLAGLKDGQVLICELHKIGRLKDRWLIHRDYNDEFRYLENDEEIRIWRAVSIHQEES